MRPRRTQAILVTVTDLGGEFTEACADAQGQYSFGAPPGEYFIDFRDPSGLHLTEYGTFVTVAPGEHVAGVDAQLTPAGIVTGQLIDGTNGHPIAGLCVYATDLQGSQAEIGQDVTCSDAEGHWRISTSQEQIFLFTDGDESYATVWYESGLTVDDATLVQVTIGETTTVNDLVLSAGGIVTGTVTDEVGEPIEDACVRVTSFPHSRIGGCDGGVVTDADGRIHNG